MKTLFVVPQRSSVGLSRLQAVLGDSFEVVTVGTALYGRRDLQAAIISPPRDPSCAQQRGSLNAYIDDIAMRLGARDRIVLL